MDRIQLEAVNVTGFRFLVFLVVLFGLSGCGTTRQQTQNALTLTPEHFKNTAIVEDDDLEVTAIVSTEKGSKRRQGLLHFVYEDNFLRAFIDKATDEVTYQVYQSIYYEASDWRFYRKANYEAPDGLKTADAKLLKAPIAHGFDCPGHTSSVCTYNEHVGFSVDRELLDSIASTYEPNKSVKWNFKFIPRDGDDFHDGLLVAEVVGFLQAVDWYRESKGS